MNKKVVKKINPNFRLKAFEKNNKPILIVEMDFVATSMDMDTVTDIVPLEHLEKVLSEIKQELKK